uniref:Retrovirus-related Pol polyprotein from transposon TNT 1-94 n=1 Tax=Tanacetum cinerariifolium TaxID=118510 RepID=A0A6L2KX60_TANCI|nr:retrovirus-related Pol polyprotein from transposon TNT 1-94 [Tanacetum cinerariifolium]
MVADDDEMSKEKEINKLMALISLSFKKIYKPTNNNLRTSSNTSRANHVILQGLTKALFNAEQADWRDDTDDEPDDLKLEAHYLYMENIQKVTLDVADNSGPIIDAESLQKVQNNNDNYNVFANGNEHPKKPESVNDTYPDEQGDTNIPTDSLDMSNNGGQAEDDDLARECDLLASLIEKLKCEIDDSKKHNKFLESSTNNLVDKLKGSRGINIYSITLQDTSTPNPICLMAKASSSQAWLWHHHLSHLNFDSINLILKYDIVTGLPKLKFVKDRLCSSWYSTQSRAYRVYNKRKRVIIETIHEYAQVNGDKFINIFSTPIQERKETSSRYVDSSNMHTFYQRHPSEYRWTKYHSLKQVIGNPSQLIRTRRQLETDGEMSMFALTVSRTEPKNIKEAMVDSAWIELMLYMDSSKLQGHGTMNSPTSWYPKDSQKVTKVKQIFWYLKNTINMGLWYPKDTDFNLTSFLDLDHACYLDTRKRTSSGIQFLGGDKLVSWSSKKPDCNSLSSVEAKYVSLSACCAQVLWLRTQLTDYGFHFDKISMYCDSKATISISCNPVQHLRTKHIDVRYNFIKEQVENGIVKLFFVGTEYQLADLVTKALSKDRFKYLVKRFGMRCLTLEELEVLANEFA